MIAEGADAGRMARSTPIEKAVDDALLVYGQNSEALRPEQGYPLRLLLPGWERERKVVAAAGTGNFARHVGKRDRLLHRLDARWKSAPIQLGDGRALADASAGRLNRDCAEFKICS
jgi:hypothetical protein